MMNDLKFCPNCGKETLIWDGEKKLACKVCGFTLYHNCAAAVAVILKVGDEILLTRRNQDPAKGKLDLPGGFSDPRESAEETCRREIFEEMDFEIDKTKLKILATQPNIYRYKDIDYNTLDIFFECEIASKPDVKLELKEISEIVWIKKFELDLDEIAFESQKKFLADYIGKH